MSLFFNRLKFLASATNQHGLHSPFVFNYITKCIYHKKTYKQSKTIDVLLKSIAYFNYQNIQVIGNTIVRDLIRQKFKNCNFDENKIDLMYADELTPKVFNVFLSEEKTHNNSMLLINSINKNKNTLKQWQQIVAAEKATVTIDFFSCGVVFKRKEQVKEHFKIRL
ncbi:hypothetical protein JQC67_10055 [Aurantibacter crassamenti]|uniref:hypothetical protein n=1 Tax=Aurantibacter crassamenti TaxID=1837375 RepID=UPI001939903C|nr:hypothetical protein [Aurantibacter crassamenti]MBM1106481.1 hypothetical protein [Aurantibacter crassamenti]